MVSVLRLVLGVAYDQGLVETNHAAGVKKLKMGKGHRPWEEWEIEQFRSTHPPDTMVRVGFELLLNTGQRLGDVSGMVRQQISNGEISVVQEKTNERLWVPVSSDLATVLEPWLASSNHIAVIVGEKGATVGKSWFSHSLLRAFRAAGLKGVTTHGLRYTAATRLKEIGLGWEDVASITGHATMQMAKKYTSQKRRARGAIRWLNEATK